MTYLVGSILYGLGSIIYPIASIIILIAKYTGAFKHASTWLIQDFLSNASWVFNVIAFIGFSIALIANPTDEQARVLLSFIPLAAWSLRNQIKFGVDAIRLINPLYDNHRGPLYPSMWYKHFSLYDPHGKDGLADPNEVMNL